MPKAIHNDIPDLPSITELKAMEEGEFRGIAHTFFQLIVNHERAQNGSLNRMDKKITYMIILNIIFISLFLPEKVAPLIAKLMSCLF